MPTKTVEEVTRSARRQSTVTQFVGIALCFVAFVGCALVKGPGKYDDAFQIVMIGIAFFVYGRMSSKVADLGEAFLRTQADGRVLYSGPGEE